jgi:hypothetical protein
MNLTRKGRARLKKPELNLSYSAKEKKLISESEQKGKH